MMEGACRSMKYAGRFIGVRNFLIIFFVLIALLFAADKLLPVFSVQINPELYDDNVDFMRLEKTPVERFLTVTEARELCRRNNTDVSGYTVGKYPLIDDMPSTEATDDRTAEIVVIGDSFVWGDNSLNRNELFWRQTERILRSKGYDCRVTAIGMAGANAYEEIEWCENYLKEHTPDLVVFGYVFNDTLRDSGEEPKENDELSDYIPVLKPVEILFPNIYDRLDAYIAAKTLYVDKYDAHRQDSLRGILKGDVKAYYKKHFADRLDAISKQTGVPAVVMTLPVIPHSVNFKELFKPLKDIYAGTSVKFYDLYPAFDAFYSAKHKKNVFVNPGNNHPGSAVHYFYASFLSDALERDFPAVLGEKKNESLLSRVINVNECTPCGIDLELIAQSGSQAEYTFAYPGRQTRRYLFSQTDRYWLTYPWGKSYIKLSFENPVDISSLQLSGAPPEKTEICYTRVNDCLGYDDNTLFPAVLTGDVVSPAGGILAEKVTSLCIHIDEDAVPQGRLRLTIRS